MAIEFPVRSTAGPTEGERIAELGLPRPVSRRLPLVYWARRHQRLLAIGVFTLAVLGFSGGWTGGALVLDGPGISLYVRLAVDHLGADRAVPYWLGDLWTGAPIWAVTPTLPIFLLVPLATALGPEVAVKIGILTFQIFGACGAYTLARSLWRNEPAAVAAGVLFALQPIVLSHGALAGSQPTIGVMAAAPWLVWALRKGLRGDGPGYLAGAGLLGGFAVLMQAEYAIGLALLCTSLVAVEIGRVGTGRNPTSLLRLAGRAAAVVTTGLGACAYWLLPFASLGRSFVLSPPELVQGELFNGSSALVARELGVFFGRGGPLAGAVGFNRDGLLPLFFHLGWVCLALTFVTIVALARRERDNTLAAVLLSAVLGVWLSTAAIPLASSGPASRTQVVPFILVGLTAGLLIGALVRPLRLGRWAPPVIGAAFVFLAAVPYLTPFVTLQKLLPLFESIRFPRFYAVAPLALALGAAYPVVMAQEWVERRRGQPVPAALGVTMAGAVALVVVGAVLVDVWPYRSYYRIRPPATAAAYRQVVATLAATAGDFRVAPSQIEPSAVDSLLDAERPLAVGWPHFVASKQAWRLTAEPFLTPLSYRERAYGLSATAFQVTEQPTGKGSAAEAVPSIELARIANPLPMVRTYNRTVAMAGRDLTPELAIALAYRNVGVFTGSPDASEALAATTVVDIRSATPCADGSVARLDPALASQLGVACGLHAWVSTLFAGVDLVNIGGGGGIGAVFQATTDRLQGVSAYLDRIPGRAELSLREVRPDDGSLGPELARGMAVGVDENGLAAFTFNPINSSAGKEYAFLLDCPSCEAETVPRLVVGHSVDQPGNLLIDGALRRDRSAAFAPIYEAVAADPPTTTTVQPSRPGPGRWRIQASGTRPALLVVAEAWFPGWEAKVDGVKVPVVEADGAFLGVPVGAGDHVVTLEYRRPAAAGVGRAITAATLLLLAVGAVVRRRRRGPGLAVALGPPATPRRRPEEPGRFGPPVPAAPAGEEEWDQVVTIDRTPSPPPGGGDRERPPDPPPPARRPGTARWPPEPL